MFLCAKQTIIVVVEFGWKQLDLVAARYGEQVAIGLVGSSTAAALATRST